MSETLQVLVTDDEEGMRLGVQRALARYAACFSDLNAEVHYHVVTAGTGEEALKMVAQLPPDLLLLDYKLPGQSGLDILAELHPYRDKMLTVMITAYASLRTAIEATKSGAFDFLPKPFTPEELKAAVRKATRHLLLQRRAQSVENERRRARFELISVVSHELKAPLGAIEGYLNLLEGGYADPETQHKVYGRCRARLEGMRKLIFDLLDLTRIESGQRQRDVSEVDLTQIALAALDSVQSAAGERGISVQLEAPASTIVMADPREMEIIFDNLLSNAVKYNRDKGQVTVTICEREAQIQIDVADTGIGLTEVEASRLFGEFVRIRKRETQGITGSGLGLSIVRRIAAMYGGSATVSSLPGQGATFTVTLDRQRSQKTAQQTRSSADSCQQ